MEPIRTTVDSFIDDTKNVEVNKLTSGYTVIRLGTYIRLYLTNLGALSELHDKIGKYLNEREKEYLNERSKETMQPMQEESETLSESI